MQSTYKLSQEGHEKLIQELKELKGEKRKKAVKRLAKARSMGDLKENSEYTAAREGLSFIDERITEIEAILENVEIIDESKKENVVQIGDTVIVNCEGSDQTLTIVGEMEADITKGCISDSSPLGKALLGKKVGKNVSVKVPAGLIEYSIIKIK